MARIEPQDYSSSKLKAVVVLPPKTFSRQVGLRALLEVELLKIAA